jgi:hypothetical protein
MKAMTRIISAQRSFCLRMVCFSILFIGLWQPVFSQEDTEEEVEEKAIARMSLEYFVINDVPKLIATVKSKIDGVYESIGGVEISFYKGEIGEDNLLGKETTNVKGEAVLKLTHQGEEGTGEILYLAAIENNETYEDREEEISIIKAVMKMKLEEEEDSTRWIRVFIGALDSEGEVVPAEDVDCNVFVKRMFGLLPLSDIGETTDEDGFVNIELPGDIPGDEEGNITIVAKVEDHESFGNLEVTQAAIWGVPIQVKNFDLERELWSARSNAPLLLIFIVNVVIIGIWSVIVFIFMQILKINRLGKRMSNPSPAK